MTDPIIVSYSELDTFRQCPMKHRLSYVERWRKPQTEGARSRGTNFHSILELHYGVLQKWQQEHPELLGMENPPDHWIREPLNRACRAVTVAVDKWVEDETERDHLMWMYLGYLEMYPQDHLRYRIVAIEDSGEFVLGTTSWGQEVRVKYKIDLIVEDMVDGGYEIWDHKTGKNLPTRLSLELDGQFDIYVVAKRLEGLPVRAAVRNGVRTQRNQADYPGYKGKSQPQTLDQRFDRQDLDRNDPELRASLRETLNLVEEIYRPGRLEYTGQNPDTCAWKCDFKDVHIFARRGDPERDLLEEQGFEQNFRRN